MHGRPRKAPKPEDLAASAAKAEKLRILQSQFLLNHHQKIFTKEALELSSKLLEINPECYTAWNYRKLAVQHSLLESNLDPDSVNSILDQELRVVENALRQNFKSIRAWYHRKWVLNKGHSSTENELRLLDKLQNVDPRNFHAWNYRRKRFFKHFHGKSEVLINGSNELGLREASFVQNADDQRWLVLIIVGYLIKLITLSGDRYSRSRFFFSIQNHLTNLDSGSLPLISFTSIKLLRFTVFIPGFKCDQGCNLETYFYQITPKTTQVWVGQIEGFPERWKLDSLGGYYQWRLPLDISSKNHFSSSAILLIFHLRCMIQPDLRKQNQWKD
ncbi:hypothetical protein NC652_017571 [Populus alba x Populus x berolinensis]|nr:hypothetical protein NC652_017571 [Populus alba x Populus x berolinensis]